MSLSQVTQIMEDEEDEFYAQNAVATALDGIPSTLVRRSNLRISQTRAQDGTNEPTVFDLVDVDFAVLYTALGASQSASIRRFKRLPISPFNPALVLCARSSRTWNAHCPQEAGLETIVHHLAITASYSLPSLHAVWAHRMRHSMDRPQGGALWKVDDEGGGLPSWAMLIGIIYDPAAIHFVAHIPYRSLDACDQPRYLSVHFESLPFPELSPEEVSQHFLCDRYRVAVALLCIQQHVFRLTSLWDDVCQTKEEYELYATHLRSLDDKSEPGTPTPSELYSGEEYFDDDFVIDYDEDVESGPPKVPYEEIEEWRGAIETDSQCLSQATCCSINNAELVVSTDLVEASVLL
ncbi:hypothetical protein OBBRIDRAFT_837116 [Obba rivulosa]|uniref:Uncharacterized protein n=1 Tax=Obba rivulosa TaxID=1052685 RepID=A0A8E2DH52_9APHY|nr:hypothetical protein OBBRIDRAFT_837116 [Obba rivulosa]